MHAGPISISESGSCVSSNMVPGKVTRSELENFNRATESISGVHHDAVNMVLYQSHGKDSASYGPNTLGPAQNKTLKRRIDIM